MSSVLQATPQYPPSVVSALSTPPLVPASPSTHRQYPSMQTHSTHSPHSSPSREGSGHHAHQHPPASSPSSSSRRPSRRPSASDSQSGPTSSASSRAAIASPGLVPAAATASASFNTNATAHSASPDRHTSAAPDRRRNMPTAVPPRTSSTQQQQHSSSQSGSRRAAAQSAERPTDSPRRPHGDSSRELNGRIDASNDAASAQQSSSRSRRANNQQSHEPTERSSSARDGRSAQAVNSAARSPPANTSSSARGPSREASEILNSILISQPEVDIEREKERMALAQPHHVAGVHDSDAAPPPVVGTGEHGEEARRGPKSRHDHSRREKQVKFGEYILGNTIGEGEFGKVKLGWKQEGGVEVAIKLIKKDQLGSNPSRMNKIMREVAILKQLTHPNIVRLHKMEESERHFGIVLEYASGGELFDYILNHRFLKDNTARRLFAQLVSGVGYLHKKGIVHRDLKLENLLLDRNRNIIITDFGFANTFDPHEELTEDEELNLTDREFVKRMGLDKVKPSGHRKGDLMQTSCGSPCYAAPELVVSDSLYTGRKVDVWSCGVILYAMLAGYLPFDDDPANPEGDNINLLYKYIVNTPLTFPEYVSPHARDLLRRILVPNPRKRADLFEVARHSWLAEFAHVVEFITSSTTTPGDIQNTTVPAEDVGETPMLARSASVRETSKKTAVAPAIGGLATKQGTIDQQEAEAAAYAKQQRDNKRRTVQVEYVAPNTATQRGEPATTAAPATQPSSSRTRGRSGSESAADRADAGSSSPQDKPLPRDPPVSKEAYGKSAVSSRRPPSAHRNVNSTATVVRGSREPRPISETFPASIATSSGPRPPTGGSLQSTGPRPIYGQPAPPEVADTNAHGRIQQPPRSSAGYSPATASQEQNADYGRPSISVPPKFAKVSGFAREGGGAGAGPESPGEAPKGHKRSSTMSEIGGKLFGRSGSLFGAKNRKRPEQSAGEKASRRYPPVSLNNSMAMGDEPRVSMDSKRSRRSFSIGLNKKRSGSVSGSQNSGEKQHARRFSFIPGGFSLKAIGIGKDETPVQPDSQVDLAGQQSPTSEPCGRYVDQEVGREHVDASTLDGMYAQLHSPTSPAAETYGGRQGQYPPANQFGRPSNVEGGYSPGAVLNADSDASAEDVGRRPPQSAPHLQQLSQQDSADGRRVASGGPKSGRGVLQKNKRFVDAWDTDSYSRGHDHSGSSGPARKVMDFFRRRGKARAGELS